MSRLPADFSGGYYWETKHKWEMGSFLVYDLSKHIVITLFKHTLHSNCSQGFSETPTDIWPGMHIVKK